MSFQLVPVGRVKPRKSLSGSLANKFGYPWTRQQRLGDLSHMCRLVKLLYATYVTYSSSLGVKSNFFHSRSRSKLNRHQLKNCYHKIVG
jgi:hypothetical protein